MSNRFDDAARVLASPMPRRLAIRRITGLLFGSVIGSLWTRQASAAVTCSPACARGQICCDHAPKNFCIPASARCCGAISCATSQTCCTNSAGAQFCSEPAGTCCGNTSCGPAQTCCTNSAGVKFCSVSAGTCCGNTSCAPAQTCCSTSATRFCVEPARTCCGTTSCGPTEHCCGNTICCGQFQTCNSGRCSSSNFSDR